MNNEMTLKEAQAVYKPRQQLMVNGKNSLSNKQLISLLLRESENTIAETLYSTFGSLKEIGTLTVAELTQNSGIGAARAIELLAAIELGKRWVYEMNSREKQERIHTPEMSALYFMSKIAHLEQEELWVIALDTRNSVIHMSQIYKGTLNSTTIRAAELFKDAIRKNAAAIIVGHNHPSGDTSPSAEDVAITRAIVNLGKQLDIPVLDHIIIGGVGKFKSMRESGLGWPYD